MKEGLETLRATEFWVWQPNLLVPLAEVYGADGQEGEGLRLVTQALDIVKTTGERWCEAKLHRLKGELILQSSEQSPDYRVKEAEACFHKALDVARRQSAKSLELRAATSLARLWQQQGKKTEARELLAPVYNWFTEGFDTADLKDAKMLLEGLEQ